MIAFLLFWGGVAVVAGVAWAVAAAVTAGAILLARRWLR